MSSGECSQAIEKQFEWLHWATSPHTQRYATAINTYEAVHDYGVILAKADAYYMDAHFCDMVDSARLSIPDDMPFESSWMQSRCGFIYLEKPFAVPALSDPRTPIERLNMSIRAIGWRFLPAGSLTDKNIFPTLKEDVRQKILDQPWEYSYERDCYQIATFQSLDDLTRMNKLDNELEQAAKGFGCWSYFRLLEGNKVGPRAAYFESQQKANDYELDTAGQQSKLHEIRWIYTALYLMSQKLAHVAEERAPRATRRRFAKAKMTAPDKLRVVTLRRYQEHKKVEAHKTVDWQWRWSVTGHWRNQPYKDGTVKPIFIEKYIKGPENKPFRESIKLFLAKR
jgi:hypothetical protein